MELRETEAALEAVLFAAGDPVSASRLCKALDIDEYTLDSLATRLADFYTYEQRGLRLVKMDDLYQICTAAEHSVPVMKILEERKLPPISKASMEVLTIIAYYQPTTRAFVEQVRGVDSIYAISTLVEKGLIHEVGKLEVPGRPNLYGTTAVFLRSFGLSSIDDLPELPNISAEGGQMKLTPFGFTIDGEAVDESGETQDETAPQEDDSDGGDT